MRVTIAVAMSIDTDRVQEAKGEERDLQDDIDQEVTVDDDDLDPPVLVLEVVVDIKNFIFFIIIFIFYILLFLYFILFLFYFILLFLYFILLYIIFLFSYFIFYYYRYILLLTQSGIAFILTIKNEFIL